LASAAWFASTTQLPANLYVTVVPSVPDRPQAPAADAGSSVNTTGLVDRPPAA
jgi:hypothetical protein